jgi:hypothetical protein
MKNLDEYWAAVQEAVCHHCIDADANGICRLGTEEDCALITFFPEIVATVNSVDSQSMQPYVDALRANVCSECQQQEPNGFCALRHSVDCALDRYYPLVVSAIEEVNSR